LTTGLTYQFRVAARNSVGLSSYSSSISIISAIVPTAPLSLTRDNSNTDSTQVTFTWSATSSNGGSAVIDYSIYWDNGTSTWSLVTNGISTLSYTKTGVTAGLTYQFKVSARNAVGSSPQSSAFSIVAANVPSQPAAPTTALEGGQTNVIVSWTLPFNGGSSITAYKVYVQAADLTWQQDNTNCNGSNGAIASARQCTIPVSVLRAAPFSLINSSDVVARVIATNSYGDSPTSVSSTSNANMPDWFVPSAPQSLLRDDISTSTSQIKFTWSAPASNGGSPVIDYSIEWDNGTSTFTTLASGVTALTYTKTGVTSGVTYQFKVAARNSIGLSVYSGSISIIAAVVPSVPNSLTRDNANTDSTQVAFTWSAPSSNGGSAVIDYSVYWDSGSNSWSLLASGVTSLSYTKTGVTAGQTYQFTVAARNAVGSSPQTSAFSIVAANVPSQPAAPTTALDGGQTNVIVSWTQPFNGGSAITSYKIYIQAANLSWQQDNTNCNGSNGAIVSARQCTIPVTVLRAAPFSLTNTSDVVARVVATNLYGDSPTSASSTSNANLPDWFVPSEPLNLARNDALTSQSQITFTWSAPASNGG
jgi:hypothetical protein